MAKHKYLALKLSGIIVGIICLVLSYLTHHYFPIETWFGGIGQEIGGFGFALFLAGVVSLIFGVKID